MVGTTFETTPDPSDIDGVATRVELLKAVADPTRLQVLELLSTGGERCHCELEATLEIPANRLSFHLKVLRDAGLVGTRRRGRWVDYHAHAAKLDTLRAALPGPVRSGEGPRCCDGSERS